MVLIDCFSEKTFKQIFELLFYKKKKKKMKRNGMTMIRG